MFFIVLNHWIKLFWGFTYRVDSEQGSTCQTSKQFWHATARADAHSGFHCTAATLLCRRCFSVGVVALRDREQKETEQWQHCHWVTERSKNNAAVRGRHAVMFVACPWDVQLCYDRDQSLTVASECVYRLEMNLCLTLCHGKWTDKYTVDSDSAVSV